jgi:hypothetical protein
MDKERAYKSGTILTDGEILLYLAIDLPRDWTPKNNYGSKQTNYISCRTYPKSTGAWVGDIMIFSGNTGGRVPGLWLQKGYSLEHFRPISKRLINQQILKSFLEPELATHDF